MTLPDVENARCANYFRFFGRSQAIKWLSVLFDMNSQLSRIFALFLIFIISGSIYMQFCEQKVRDQLTVNFQSVPLHVVSDKFISFGLDTSLVSKGIEYMRLDSEKLRDLTMALSPAHIRLGGTMSERLIYVDSADGETMSERLIYVDSADGETMFETFNNTDKFLPYFVLDGPTWRLINKFCEITNVNLVFSINVLLRNDNGWDPRNAIDLISASKEHNYKIDWQFGNEPNSFPHVFNVSLSAKQLANDFNTLRGILNKYGYSDSMLIGPDTTRPQPKRSSCLQYMVDFLTYGSNNINVISWHQYYLNSRTATLSDFWNPDTLDLLKTQIAEMISHTDKYMKRHQMWLSETSSSYGGGADGLSNTFASSPMWLDKLGLSAKNGISVVIRQSLVGGFYSLVSSDLDPLPDWWVSWIYKKLVGTKVVACDLHKPMFQRLYCGCATKQYCVNSKSCFVIYGVNMLNNAAEIILKGSAIPFDKYDIDEYLITASSRNSVDIYINDVRLQYNNSLPILAPRKIGPTKEIKFKPHSLGFWIVKNSSLNFCDEE